MGIFKLAKVRIPDVPSVISLITIDLSAVLMLTNSQIAARFDQLAKLMELHEENPFKIKSYANAYLSLRKLEGNLSAMSRDELASIRGVGTAIADKIQEMLSTGRLSALEEIKAKTPEGIQDMLRIKGLGPKKVHQIWMEMGIVTVGELLYACNENRLVKYRGFGLKAQEEIRQKIEYFLDARGKYLCASVETVAEELLAICRQVSPQHTFTLCGDLRRKMPVVCGVELLTDAAEEPVIASAGLERSPKGNLIFRDMPVFIYSVPKQQMPRELFVRSASQIFLEDIGPVEEDFTDENMIFLQKNLPAIPPECREWQLASMPGQEGLDSLVQVSDIKGIIHNHSTYSDGLHSLEEMALYVHQQGFEYFVISDHSRSAGYAGGLRIEDVYRQWSEIDELNKSFGNQFHVFKSIESDILTDGSLDYPDDVLAGFDLVIASVHSVLTMDEARATSRLIKAIEHPATRILGHPTGRLLLARPGYPINEKKVIDACAANGVAIELNANPQRLDMDWTWIPYAQQKSVMVSINPDAHSKESIHYVRHGVNVARKGLLDRSACLNSLSCDQFIQWLATR